MKSKRILLTGDDGYNSIGIRILVNILKKNHDLFIAATRDQMSGVGGHLNLLKGGTWGESTVDGVPAFWVDGYPCDAVECALGNFNREFDLVISGINWGMNIGSATISSGTYSAAIRAMGIGLAPRAIVFSWMVPESDWHIRHSGDDDLDDYMEYPGRTVKKLIYTAIRNNMWGAHILNINLPAKKSSTVRFTEPLIDTTRFFTYPRHINRKTHIYSYYIDKRAIGVHPNIERRYDIGAVMAGDISITPHTPTGIDVDISRKLNKKRINL